MTDERTITIIRLADDSRRLYQTTQDLMHFPGCIFGAMESLGKSPLIGEVDGEMGDKVLGVTVKDPQSWKSAEQDVLRELISGLGWAGYDVAIYDRMPHDFGYKDEFRETGAVKIVKKQSRYVGTSIAA